MEQRVWFQRWLYVRERDGEHNSCTCSYHKMGGSELEASDLQGCTFVLPYNGIIGYCPHTRTNIGKQKQEGQKREKKGKKEDRMG